DAGAVLGGAPAEDLVDAVEDERSELLRRLSDPLSLSERDAERVRHRLAAVETWLVQAYDARLAPPAPRHRVVEHGLVLFADAWPGDEPDAAGTDQNETNEANEATPPREANETTERYEVAGVRVDPSPGRAPAMALVAAATADEAARLLAELPRHEARPGAHAQLFVRFPGVAAWLEVRSVGGVAHLRLVPRGAACLLPRTISALADGGARVAFTLANVNAVQFFHRGPLPDTLLKPAGDGWWSIGRGDFLRHEGWGAAESGHPARKGGGSRGSGRTGGSGGSGGSTGSGGSGGGQDGRRSGRRARGPKRGSRSRG